jgi:Protein of unknown function DUF262
MNSSEKTGDLLVQIDDTTVQVRTRTLDVSFNEILDMFNSNELKITPDFQRLFRWSETKQSQFIESLILELPVPPIYVIENQDGVYELIDGLQRISSYLHFRGKRAGLDGDDNVIYENHDLVLQNCDFLKSINGLSFKELPLAIQIKLKRHFIRMDVLRRESDKRLRYHMFKRLNTGGELLSEQEVRNCTIRLLDNKFNDFLKKMAKNDDYLTCMFGLPEEKRQQMYLEEFVLRFFAFKNYRENYEKNIGDFLTTYMEAVSDTESDTSFDYEQEEKKFNDTFALLNKLLSDSIFSGVGKSGKSQGYFSALHFECISLGIQKRISEFQIMDDAHLNTIRESISNLKIDSEFQRQTKGGGKNYSAALEKRIKYVEDWLDK